MLLADLGVTTAIAKLAIYEIQLWMGDVLLVSICRGPLFFWMPMIPSDLPSLLRRWQEMDRRGTSCPNVLHSHQWVVFCCPFSHGDRWELVACSSHSVYYASRFDFTQPQTLPAILWSIRKWSIATFSVTVAGNIYCLGMLSKGFSEAERSDPTSALISFFIWRTHRAVCQTTSSGLQVRVFAWSCKNGVNLVRSQSVLRIIIESAGMWVFFILLTFIVYLSNENACYIFLYLVCPRFYIRKAAPSVHHSHGTD